MIVDDAGEVVWFFESVAVQGSTRRDNGNFVFLDVGSGVLEVAPTGELVAVLSQETYPGRRAHHDVIATPDNFSFITSLARRLPNGNTFVAFGAGPDARSSFGPVEVFEVDPSGAVQFRIEVGGPTVNDLFILYRASPLSDIAGEDNVS